jgi:hypothetical protein
MTSATKLKTSKAIIATLLTFSFLIFPRMGSVPTVRAAAGEIRSESQVKTEAALYDSAIRALEQGLTIKLETIEDLKVANALLAKQVPNLRYNRSKLVTIGLSDSTFVAAVRDRTKDSKSTDAFTRELGIDPSSILKLSGASSVGDRMQRKLETDVGLIRRVAARLQQAATDLKAKVKQDHASGRRNQLKSSVRGGEFLATVAGPPSGPAAVTPSAEDVVTLLVLVAISVNPVIFAGLLILASGPIIVGVAVVSAVAVAALIGRLVENLGTDKGRDKVAKCQDGAEAVYKNCVAGGAGACCGLAEINAAACLAAWFLEAAACLLA